MRQILDNHILKNKVSVFNQDLFKSRDEDFELPYLRLRFLNKQVRRFPATYGGGGSAIKMSRYIKKIRREYLRILNADNVEIGILIAEFELILPSALITEKFWKAIIWAMRYDALRDREFLDVLRPIGIKTCVYCHSQLTLVVRKKIAKIRNAARNISVGDVLNWSGLLELDHRFPKSKYPFLCTSFFNLYPICASCNKAKNDKHSDFSLYHVGPELNVFRFSLPNNSVIKYLRTKDAKQIEINFNHINPGVPENDKLVKEYNAMFSISEIYRTQRDVVEELIHKQQVYTKDYNRTLINDFKKLFPDDGMFTRLVIGTYEQETDVHRRPLAKFIQDISRNIKLIDDSGSLHGLLDS